MSEKQIFETVSVSLTYARVLAAISLTTIIVLILFTLYGYIIKPPKIDSSLFSILTFELLWLCISIYVMASFGTLSVNNEEIVHNNRIGKYIIRWEEVKSVESDHYNQAIVFNGNNKRLVIPGPAYSYSDNSKKFFDTLNQEIRQRSLIITFNGYAHLKFNKNTKST